MKCKVQLFKAGTLYEEVVIAVDYQDAKKVALARNPNATVVSVTAVFLWQQNTKNPSFHDQVFLIPNQKILKVM